MSVSPIIPRLLVARQNSGICRQTSRSTHIGAINADIPFHYHPPPYQQPRNPGLRKGCQAMGAADIESTACVYDRILEIIHENYGKSRWDKPISFKPFSRTMGPHLLAIAPLLMVNLLHFSWSDSNLGNRVLDYVLQGISKPTFSLQEFFLKGSDWPTPECCAIFDMCNHPCPLQALITFWLLAISSLITLSV